MEINLRRVPILVDALCDTYGYSEFVKDVVGEPTEKANKETRIEFSERMIRRFLQETVDGYKLRVARDGAVKATILPDIEVT